MLPILNGTIQGDFGLISVILRSGREGEDKGKDDYKLNSLNYYQREVISSQVTLRHLHGTQDSWEQPILQ